MEGEITTRWLLRHAVRIGALLVVGYSIAWVVGEFFSAVLIIEWLPREGMVGVIQQVSQLLAVLYVVAAGTSETGR